MLRLHTVVTLLFLAVNICAAQDAAPDESGPSSSHDAYQHFAEQEKSIWRENAEKLTAIDKAYREALAALSAENAKRTQAIFAENSAAHKSLSEQGLQGSERNAEYSRIQAASKKAQAEKRAWYETESRALREDYSLKRAAQMTATEALIEQLGAQRVATLERLLSGPVNLDNLPALTFPEDETPTTGGTSADPGDAMPSPGTGVDLAGTVDLDRQDDPTLELETPVAEVPPKRPLQAHIDAVSDAEVNTHVAPNDFDLALYSIDNFKFVNQSFKDGTLRGDPLRVTMIVANRGAKTYAFRDNELVVEIVEGVHDFSSGDVVSSRRPQKTRAVFEFAIPAEHGIQIDIPLFRQDERSAFKKLRDGLKVGLSAGVKSVDLFGGSSAARIIPNIWYTLDVRLTTPREYDNAAENHGAYLHIRFDDEGSVIERDGPFFFEPRSTMTAEDKF